MLLLTFYVSIAIGVSFVCSVLEAVLLSISPSYIAQLRQQEHPAASGLLALKEDIDRPLASDMAAAISVPVITSLIRVYLFHACRLGPSTSIRAVTSATSSTAEYEAGLVPTRWNTSFPTMAGKLSRNHDGWRIVRGSPVRSSASTPDL